MTDATHDDAGLVCERLADVLADYFRLLGRGLADDTVDAAVQPLLGLQLNALGGEATAQALRDIDRLAEAILVSAVSTPVRITATATVSEPGVPGYAPTLAEASGDDVFSAWLAFEPEDGDRLVVRRLGVAVDALWPITAFRGTTTGRQVVVRPTLTSGPGVDGAWLLYSAPSDVGWSVWARHVTAAGLGSAELVSSGVDHALNQEAVIDPAGTLRVVLQELHDGTFRAAYRERDGESWTDSELLSPEGENAWDPCLVGEGGELTVFWSSYRRGLFRIMARSRSQGRWGDEREAPTGAQRHALHPQAVADPGGGAWLAYDSLAVPDQTTSGLTRYRPVGEVRDGVTHDPIPGFGLTCHVDVLLVRGGEFHRPAAGGPIAESAAACYPRVAVDGQGVLWLAHRTMRQLPFGDYLAHVAVRAHVGADWSPPRLLPASDGTCSELSLRPAEQGVTVLYHGDGHAERHLAMLRGHMRPDAYATGEEALRREHLRLPSTERMAAGGHVGEGLVTVSTLRSDHPARPTELVAVVSQERGHEPVELAVGPRDHRPVGWPPNGDGAARQLFWGDLHRHSNVSRCGAGLDIGTDDHYRFADDLLGCDFWALTDHAENTSELNWHHLKKLANAFYRPGAHASLVGFEWTSFLYGHYNVIYAGDDGPIFSSVEAETDNPSKLWERLEPHEALTIPHHPAAWVYPTDWSYRHDRFLRLVEVFQACTGSYESDWCHRQYQDALAPGASVQDALAAGQRLGFIGSTDHGNGAAYVGVYSEKLDRASIVRALSERRCFAATRRGIVPELRVGGASMGEEVTLAEGEIPPLVFGAVGVSELSVVQLVRDGEVVASSQRAPSGRARLWVPLDLQLRSHDGGPRDMTGQLSIVGDATVVPTEWCQPEVTSIHATSVMWSTALPERYGKRYRPPGVVNIGVTIEGSAKALVTVEAGGVALRATLAELNDGRTSDARAEGCEIRARLGVGGLTGMGTTSWLVQADPGILRAGSWYYVRVIQVDGEAAWSSPVWVD